MNTIWIIVFAIAFAIFIADGIANMVPPYILLGTVMVVILLFRIEQSLRRT